MGIAALILGIVSIILALVPFCGAIAFFPAIVGLILGIVDIVQKSKKKEKIGMSVSGVVLSAIAIVAIFIWIFVLSFGIASTIDIMDVNGLSNFFTRLDSIDGINARIIVNE